jgi:hypothetical protein
MMFNMVMVFHPLPDVAKTLPYAYGAAPEYSSLSILNGLPCGQLMKSRRIERKEMAVYKHVANY